MAGLALALALAFSTRVSLTDTGATSQAPTAQSVSYADVISKLEAQVPALLAQNKIPGLAMAMVDQTRVVWSAGFGVTDYRSAAPVDHVHHYARVGRDPGESRHVVDNRQVDPPVGEEDDDVLLAFDVSHILDRTEQGHRQVGGDLSAKVAQ